MRILLSGLSGTGSTTAARRIAADFGLEYVYGGQIFRNMAAEKGISLESMVEALERNPEIEREVDEHLIEAAREDNILVESRTIGWILPKEIPAYRVWLTCDLQERLRRVQAREHNPRSPDNLLFREASDNRRYFNLYGIRPGDFSPFDLVLDTTTLPVDEVVERIEDFIRKREGERRKGSEAEVPEPADV